MEDPVQLGDAVAATEGHLVVLSMLRQADASMIDGLVTLWTPLQERFGDQTRFLAILTPTVKIPDEATRERVKDFFRQGFVAGKTAILIDGGGFWAAAFRGVIAGFSILSKSGAHSVGTVREALAHLDFAPADIDRLDVEIAHLRSAHRTRLQV